jgi:uncharacterized protein with HEPN domain
MAPSKNPRNRLQHMLFHIKGVEGMMPGVTFEQFCAEYQVERAVERALEVISEAAKALPPELTARYPGVVWEDIIGIGNILRHKYEDVDPEILWDIVQNHLPTLKEVVVKMLAREFEDA